MTPRTFAADDSLPRVPLPTLEDSCDRFLRWCTPLLTADELAATEAAVADLLRADGPGRTLHAALAEYDATPGVGSWLDLFWPSRYLGRRDRIALNANFFFLFRDETTLAASTAATQVDRAVGIICAAVDYKLSLDAEAIPPVLQRGQALSMWQNKYLFSETRIPGAEQDTVRVPYSAEWPGPSDAKHVVVFFRGSMFRMDVIGPDGAPYSLDDLACGLREVLKIGARSTRTDSAVGHLTTKARAEWAASRQALLAEPVNAAALDTIETALFCVCLEDFAPRDELHACDQLLHGDSANRWFDKAVSFIVFGDGQAGINVEHCGLDGTTILSFVDTMLETSAQEHADRSGARAQGLPAVEPIDFVLDAAQRNDIAAAGADFVRYAAENATQTVSFADFGTTRAKQLGISPDAFAQLSYQLAHRRSKGITGATYESIATRQYRNGRTEAMRVVTPEMVAFVDAMQDDAADAPARLAAARTAAAAHVARAKECQAGAAPEQHLWELQWIQRRRGAELGVTEPIPLYDSPGWTIMRDDYLSTSSAPSVNIRYFGFGSTSPRCIGVAYVLLPDRWNLYLATPTAVADQMHAFADHLRTAVADLEALLSAG
ncbi:carnitine O-acetyltransferase [Nocardia tenerifensis]|uniref:Carnitine O-acetyltransferase n=2 Tax=Nocardia tenerifensis TaxID=228006 RepID=A0A318K6U2_9NOCA|nr:choline/carnitine O-acyltransferase [Nocardia tenerifensis]PXX59236.1 carnitine O-acetyltransferase [Nocardia tenerifensis]